MKQTLIIISFIAAINCFGQIPDYFANNPTWQCSEWNSDQWATTPNPYNDYYIYYLNGDTSAFGYTYHKVFKKVLEITI